MGIAYYPTQKIETVLVQQVAGVTTASFLLLAVNGVVYANGYRINYNRGYRLFSPTIDSSGSISITCLSIAYGEDLPDISLQNIEVYIIV